MNHKLVFHKSAFPECFHSPGNCIDTAFGRIRMLDNDMIEVSMFISENDGPGCTWEDARTEDK